MLGMVTYPNSLTESEWEILESFLSAKPVIICDQSVEITRRTVIGAFPDRG